MQDFSLSIKLNRGRLKKPPIQRFGGLLSQLRRKFRGDVERH